MAEAHAATGWVVIGAHALVGCWWLLVLRFARLRSPALTVVTAATQVAMFVQVVLGVAAMRALDDDVEVADFHLFYGFLCLVSIGIVVSYRNQVPAERRPLLDGAGALWIGGLALRAATLSPFA